MQPADATFRLRRLGDEPWWRQARIAEAASTVPRAACVGGLHPPYGPACAEPRRAAGNGLTSREGRRHSCAQMMRASGQDMDEPAQAEPPHPPQRVGVRDFRTNLTGFLRQVRHGASFLVMSHGEVLAEVRPPPESARPSRQPGALRGRIRMAPDFDTLPPDVLAAIEGEEA